MVRCGKFDVPPGQCACPPTTPGGQGNYPLQDYRHVANAAARFAQARTRKCPGGAQRICSAAKKFGVKSKVCRR